MNILVSNDDGIFSEGIFTLAKVLRDEGHKVYVVAPDGNRSAFSHSLSIFKELSLKKVNILDGVEWYSLSGTPADCVKFGIHYFDNVKFDLVCSGINHGGNLGTDVYYSGTVSAGVEANVCGIPAIAFSNNAFSSYDFVSSGEAVKKIMNLLKNHLDTHCTFNVNIPNLPIDKIKGIKFTKLGVQLYTDNYVLTDNNTFMLVGDPIINNNIDRDCDVELCNEGYVTVTPIITERTDFGMLEKLKKENE